MQPKRDAIEYANTDEYELRLSSADIERLARALTISATYMLDKEIYHADKASHEVLSLREDILEQKRRQKYGDE